jgi:hypothetical protein
MFILGGIATIVSLIYVCWYVFRSPIHEGWDRFPDFRIYYHAALGEFDWKPRYDSCNTSPIGWLYPKWLRFIWVPFTGFSEGSACRIWFVASLTAWIFLCLELVYLPMGWLLILVFTKPIAVMLWSGNVAIILASVVTVPAGAAISSLFKPYLLFFLWLASYIEEIARWLQASF